MAHKISFPAISQSRMSSLTRTFPEILEVDQQGYSPVEKKIQKKKEFHLRKLITFNQDAELLDDSGDQDPYISKVIKTHNQNSLASLNLLEKDNSGIHSSSNRQLMKVRKDLDGNVISRSVLGKAEMFQNAESQKLPKQLTTDVIVKNRIRINKIQSSQTPVGNTHTDAQNYNSNFTSNSNQKKAHDFYSRTNQNKNHINQSYQFQTQKKHQQQQDQLHLSDFFQDNSYLTTNVVTNRHKKAEDRHTTNQQYWDAHINLIKSKVNSKASLIEKQQIHAVARQELLSMNEEGKSNYFSRRGSGVDIQIALRGFYQGLRDSNVAFTSIQTKNPFTMIWATTPSPERISQHLSQSFQISNKLSQDKSFKGSPYNNLGKLGNQKKRYYESQHHPKQAL